MAQQLFFRRRARSIDVGRMSIEVVYACNPDSWELTRTGTGEQTVFTWWDRSDMREKTADVLKLRAAFEEVSSLNEAEDFLKRSGPFRSGATTVTWERFQKWQSYFREQRLKVSGFGDQPEHSRYGEFSERVVQPVIKVAAKEVPGGDVEITNWILCESVVETIAALNLLDRIRRADVRPCARKACEKLFEKLDKRKTFCCHQCAVKAPREARQRSRKISA